MEKIASELQLVARHLSLVQYYELCMACRFLPTNRIPIYDFESYQATTLLLSKHPDPSELLMLDVDYVYNESFMFLVSNGHGKEVKRLLQVTTIDISLKKAAFTYFLDESNPFYPAMVLDLLNATFPSEFNVIEYYTPMFHRTIAYGNLENVKEYIQKYNVDPSDSDSFSFRVACTKHRDDIAEYLFQDDRVDPSADNNYSLRWASSSGNVSLTKLLLTDIRVDPAVDSNYPIRMASSIGNTELVAIFLADPRVNPFDEDNYAIRWAASNGHLGVVKLLVEEGRVDPSSANNFAILASSNNGHVNVVDYLMKDQRVDPSVNGNYAIRFAAENGHIGVVERLLKDPRVSPEAEYNHAIRIACRKGYLEIVKLLLSDPRVDPSAEHDYAIKWAAQNGHIDIVKILLQHPYVNPATGNNQAINAASKNGHYDIVSLLFADPRVDPSQDNNYAIRFACKNGHLKVVQLLLTDDRVRKDINTSYAEAFRWAAQNGHVAIVQQLLSKTDVEPQSLDNFALKAAAQFGHAEVVEILLKDPRCDPTADQNHAIRIATDNGHLEVVQTLLGDSRVDPTDDDDYTIYAAARSGYIEILRALLLDSRLSSFLNFEEAVRHARMNGHQAIVDELEERYLALLPRVVIQSDEQMEEDLGPFTSTGVPHEIDDLTLNNDISNLANLSEAFLNLDGENSDDEIALNKKSGIFVSAEVALEPKLSVSSRSPLERESVMEEGGNLMDEIMAEVEQNLSDHTNNLNREAVNQSVHDESLTLSTTNNQDEMLPRFDVSQNCIVQEQTAFPADTDYIDNTPRFLIDTKSEEATAGSMSHEEGNSEALINQPRFLERAEIEDNSQDQNPRHVLE
ncbi:hypothetical protein HDV04_000497 [Boothiomyces sp. JEL0838]|nr:hypothetical protein HDV04_000497 [Boothiomyces sp. JEL0838]